MTKTLKEIAKDREKVYNELLPGKIRDNAYATKIKGITGISAFNEPYPPKDGMGKYRMKIAIDILALDKEKPFLAIELESSPDPQKVMGLFPLYMLTQWIKIRKHNQDLNQYPVEQPFLLLIILPELSDKLVDKWRDLDHKIRELLKLDENKQSNLTDFEICQLKDFQSGLKRLLERNGYQSLI
ncbi:MAG: hypothetical protein LLF83_05960 [Methanobacterium sp.]|nr:hypothetical protein [Methanobacterium sp.]